MMINPNYVPQSPFNIINLAFGSKLDSPFNTPVVHNIKYLGVSINPLLVFLSLPPAGKKWDKLCADLLSWRPKISSQVPTPDLLLQPCCYRCFWKLFQNYTQLVPSITKNNDHGRDALISSCLFILVHVGVFELVHSVAQQTCNPNVI